MLRPARLLKRLASPCQELSPMTGPPAYGRACPSQGLPRPKSAITTRPNHPLPGQDFHLQACQRPEAARTNLVWNRSSTINLGDGLEQEGTLGKRRDGPEQVGISCPNVASLRQVGRAWGAGIGHVNRRGASHLGAQLLGHPDGFLQRPLLVAARADTPASA